MSKFRVIEGHKDKIKESNIRFIEDRIRERGRENLTQTDCIVFAYHYATNGDIINARRLLKRVTSFYWTHEIYKDLYKALLSWSLKDITWNEYMQKEYEFFIIVKRSIPLFQGIEFPSKKEFIEFAKQFHKNTTVIM